MRAAAAGAGAGAAVLAGRVQATSTTPAANTVLPIRVAASRATRAGVFLHVQIFSFHFMFFVFSSACFSFSFYQTISQMRFVYSQFVLYLSRSSTFAALTAPRLTRSSFS